ncbi:MATE family efflux transporter [Petrotoga sp. Shatin.DS.tank11.9.2.9.3]|uniref:MATE family efflux transporter n=1 Tax=Petrotoga sp. Shatin.DS.tank11.9.2.9.3 TaxID=1469556 RepID=UPI000EF2758C|nr:MATE family efflux transporter [Petrotoga sp. Shatin.DS.tank11.9.2.9.3]RLL83226.1 multidrug transporter MatE [Petrotoga sp. Shatin.DS.tank11.9.2.9.3]
MEENTNKLEDKKIGKLLMELSLPAIVAMLVQALYNFVDTIYIARGVGTLGIAGVSVAFPIQMIIMAFGGMIGIGGGTLISRSLGAKDVERAENALGNIFSAIFVLSIALTILGTIFLDPILNLFGATPDILSYAEDYMSVILYGAILFTIGMASHNVMRAEGNAKYAMIAMIVPGVLNIILDPIFIFVLNMEVKGAAVATVLSQLVGVIYIGYYFFSGKSSLKFHRKNFILDRHIMSETLGVGASAFVRQVAGSLLAIVLNNLLGTYGSSLHIAIFGVINRLLMFFFLPMFGIAQGFLPIAGYNYGAKRYDRVKEVLKKATIAALTWSIVSFFLVQLFPGFLLSIFSTDTSLISEGIPALRIDAMFIWVVGFQVVGSSLFQAIGRAGPALLLSMSRQILIFIPMVFVMSHFFGLMGIWYTFPISDVLSALLTLLFVIREIKILNTLQKKQVQINDEEKEIEESYTSEGKHEYQPQEK